MRALTAVSFTTEDTENAQKNTKRAQEYFIHPAHQIFMLLCLIVLNRELKNRINFIKFINHFPSQIIVHTKF